jgi:hypothetical protein
MGGTRTDAIGIQRRRISDEVFGHMRHDEAITATPDQVHPTAVAWQRSIA